MRCNSPFPLKEARLAFPKILGRKRIPISPWAEIIEKTVQFAPDSPPEIYHCVTQAPYVGILALTPDGRIPIVRQFRPAVEEFTWEFPAGTVEDGETPERAARRELREEAGLESADWLYLGQFHPDTGRMQVAAHAYFAASARPVEGFVPEKGIDVRYVRHAELKQMILSGEFRHQVHLALYAAMLARGAALG